MSLLQVNQIDEVGGESPISVTNIIDTIKLRPTIERLASESGYTLVNGSFEEGASVSLKTQVVWQQATGKIFAWFQDATKTVSAGSTPETTGGIGAGAWVDRTDVTLRSALASESSTIVVSGILAKDIAKITNIVNSTGGISIPDDVALDEQTTVNLTSKTLKTYCNGISESASLSIDYNFSRLNGEGGFSTTAANNRGWLAPLTGANWVQVLSPFGVIIGDSIAEGHPNLHGRLHQSYEDPTFNDAVTNAYGTPAFALSQRTGMHWFNAGIGGQTSAEVLSRFSRDALGNTISVGDGRPDSTLPAKPVWIWVNAGINDVSALIDVAETKTNLLKMAVMALNSGINIGFNTIGPVDAHNATQRAMQDDINEFILTALPLYGCHVFDFHAWFVDPLDNTKTNPRFSADGVHPNKTGYNNYVARMLSDCNLPIYCNGFAIESYGESYSSKYRMPTAIEFETSAGLSGQFVMTGQFGVFNPNLDLTISPLVKLWVRNGAEGINAARHSGFSNIHPIIGYKSQKEFPVAVSVEKALGGNVLKLAGVWQVSSLTQQLGIASVTATSTGVYVNFSVGVNRPTVSMSGSATPALYSATPQGVDSLQVRVRIFDRSTGAEINPTTLPDNNGFNLIAFGIL